MSQSDMSPGDMSQSEIITALLATYEPAEVPGHARQKHGLIVTQADVRAVFMAAHPGQRPSPLPKDPPADFIEHASNEFNDALADRYHVGISTISRWRRETGARPPEHRRGKPLPQGFAAVARVMGNHDLEKRYSVGIETIRRWRAECGVPNSVRAPRSKLLPFKQNGYQTAPVDRAHRDDTIAGQAADYLRRFGPVIRSNRDGRYDPNGDRWLRGSVLLTADEVIARAEFNGWRADAWKRVA